MPGQRIRHRCVRIAKTFSLKTRLLLKAILSAILGFSKMPESDDEPAPEAVPQPFGRKAPLWLTRQIRRLISFRRIVRAPRGCGLYLVMRPFAPDPSTVAALLSALSSGGIESGHNAILSADPSSAVRKHKPRDSVAPKTESDGAGCVPEATKTLPDSATTETAKTDNKTIANLIVAAGVPRKYFGRVYLKLASHALPTDEDKAKAYVRRTLQRALIDEERRRIRDRALSWHPLSALWDALAFNEIRPDDVERKKTLRALIQTGIALLSPHQRNLVRAWVDRSDENNVLEIHEALPQTCGYGAYHCKNTAFASLTRIVSGLAAATGNSDLRPNGARKCSRRRLEFRSQKKTRRRFSKIPASCVWNGERAINDGAIRPR